MLTCRDLVIGKTHLADGHAQAGGRALGQSVHDLLGRVGGSLAVQVRAGGGGRGRGVGHLAGVGGGHAYAVGAHAQGVGHHLRHLGVEALAHLGATMVHQHAAVAVHMHQRAGLVQVHHIEGDAELQRGQSQALFQDGAAGVEGRHGFAAGVVIAAGHQVADQGGQHVVDHFLPIRRGVALTHAVQIGQAHLQRVAPHLSGQRIHDQLDGHCALGAAKAPEGRVALGVGAGAEALGIDRGQPVGIVEVAQRTGHHRR